MAKTAALRRPILVPDAPGLQEGATPFAATAIRLLVAATGLPACDLHVAATVAFLAVANGPDAGLEATAAVDLHVLATVVPTADPFLVASLVPSATVVRPGRGRGIAVVVAVASSPVLPAVGRPARRLVLPARAVEVVETPVVP